MAITMTIIWSNCRLCCQMNFWKANCMTSLLHCLIHSQAFRLMELYWFVCCYSKSISLSHPCCVYFLFPAFPFTLSSILCCSSPPSFISFFSPFSSSTEAGCADQHLLHVAPWGRCVGQHQWCCRRADVCLHARQPDSPSSRQKRPDSCRPSRCSLQGWFGRQF